VTNAVDTLGQIADHAAQQSDRWMFVAMFLLSLTASVAVARYWMRDRERLVISLSEAHTRALAQTEELVKVVTANTDAMHDLGTRLDDLKRFCQYRPPKP
jgi:cob(I)alamin adenosyltransferase